MAMIGLSFCREIAKQKIGLGAWYCQQATRNFCTKLLRDNKVDKDKARRMLAAKFELKRTLYKALCRNPDIPAEFREKQRLKLSKLPRNSAFSRIRNRCIYTGRPRAVYRLFRMSRIRFRELASQGALMGIKKASW